MKGIKIKLFVLPAPNNSLSETKLLCVAYLNK